MKANTSRVLLAATTDIQVKADGNRLAMGFDLILRPGDNLPETQQECFDLLLEYLLEEKNKSLIPR